MVSHPFGTSNNVPWSVARRVGLEPSHAIYSAVGGQSPQRMVNRMAEAIYRGEVDVALITGAEAIANIKHAVRNGFELDWREEHDDPFDDEWSGDGQVSEYEMAHGLYLPLRAYPLMEHRWRHALGLSVVEHRRRMGAMFAPFTAVAADNPYAQFPLARSIDELAGVSHDNYLDLRALHEMAGRTGRGESGRCGDSDLGCHRRRARDPGVAVVVFAGLCRCRRHLRDQSARFQPLAGAEAGHWPGPDQRRSGRRGYRPS